MTLRMGMGRDEEVGVSVTETVYAGAEDWLKQRIGDRRSPCRLKSLRFTHAAEAVQPSTAFSRMREPDSG